MAQLGFAPAADVAFGIVFGVFVFAFLVLAFIAIRWGVRRDRPGRQAWRQRHFERLSEIEADPLRTVPLLQNQRTMTDPDLTATRTIGMWRAALVGSARSFGRVSVDPGRGLTAFVLAGGGTRGAVQRRHVVGAGRSGIRADVCTALRSGR